MLIFILIGLLVIIGGYLIATYNYFVTTKTRVNASVQEIGNQLKRQSELIPNLEGSAKGYLEHEKGIMEMLSEARKMTEAGKDASKQISELLPKLQVIVESNPELQAAGVVTSLMNELRDTSDKVMYARRLLIDLSADYNVRVATVPSSIIAGMFKFGALKGFETPVDNDQMKVTAEEMKTPKVNL